MFKMIKTLLIMSHVSLLKSWVGNLNIHVYPLPNSNSAAIAEKKPYAIIACHSILESTTFKEEFVAQGRRNFTPHPYYYPFTFKFFKIFQLYPFNPSNNFTIRFLPS